ncbi:hypothetical protein SNL152K_9805 [Streptomyces sp. NL15-2K]|nr:hypothetical protein SNL152K_9805 [Streptomyces sp. NL15-2K]
MDQGRPPRPAPGGGRHPVDRPVTREWGQGQERVTGSSQVRKRPRR